MDSSQDLPTTPVERLAYRARVDCHRSLFLSESLAAEAEYNDELYDICAAYERRFRSDYVEYKNAIKAESFIRHDWDHLTFRQRIAVWMHQPMLSRSGQIVAFISSVIALSSTVELVLETLPLFNPEIHSQNAWAFTTAEIFFTVFFTVETVLSIAVHPQRTKYARSLSFILDFVSCTPLYLTMFFGTFTPSISKVLDPLRMLRIFRIGRHTVSFTPVATMLAALRRSLSVLAGPLFFLTCFCFVAAGTLYYVQRGSFTAGAGYVVPDCTCQDTPFAVNTSNPSCGNVVTPISNGIPTTVWWGFATILTVGFGDVVPECAQGQIIAALCMIMSSIIMAMPIAVLGDTFEDEAGVIAEIIQMRRRELAIKTLKEHQKVAQLAASSRLHELSSEKLEALCRRAGLVPDGQPADMVRRLYRLFGLRDPSGEQSTQSSPTHRLEVDEGLDGLEGHSKMHSTLPRGGNCPAVITLAECFVDYLRLRLPFEIVDLAKPRQDVLLHINTFFQRVFNWWTRAPDPELAQRLVCSNSKVMQRVISLVTIADHTIGVEVPGIAAPDIILPTPPITKLSFGPRMATLRVTRNFGAMQYVLIPSHPFRPLVNGVEAISTVELNDRDVINFGSESEPMLYTFVRLDKFAHATMAAAKMDEKLPGRVWAAKEFQGTALDSTTARTNLRPVAGATALLQAASPVVTRKLATDVHPEWRLDAYEAPFAPVEREMQFVI